MRACTSVICTILLFSGAESRAAEPASSVDKSAEPLAVTLLREASEIALKQGPEQEYWTERDLLKIGQAQIRARDFSGAERSIRGSAYEYGRAEGIVKLAQSLAREGRREQAHEVLRSLPADDGGGAAELDGVELQWIEHLVANGELDRAVNAVQELQSESDRADAFMKIASAYARSGHRTQAAANFASALDCADKLTDQFGHARAMWQTTGAQLTVGATEAARATLRKLVDQADGSQDAWAKVAALREGGALAWKMNDRGLAQRLFRKAIEAGGALDNARKMEAVNLIAIDQARAGDVEGSVQTIALITHRKGRRDEALCAAAVAMLKTGDVEGAVRTAASINTYIQYRDDLAQEIVEYHLQKRDPAEALLVAEEIEGSSTKAAEMLKIAVAYAKSGDRRTAARVASRIELACDGDLGLGGVCASFDYQSPQTWGVCYEPGFTMGSTLHSHRQAAKVATAAMVLAHELQQKPAQPYETSFKDFDEAVIRELARTHARIGDRAEAVAWARKIGSDAKVASQDDFETFQAAERRIHALLGAAEGILDRAGETAGGLPP